MYHLLAKPAVGGTPIMDSAPTVKAAIVHGIRRPIPVSSLTLVLCAATKIAPAQKNSVILPNACMARCMAPPTTLAVLASIAANTT